MRTIAKAIVTFGALAALAGSFVVGVIVVAATSPAEAQYYYPYAPPPPPPPYYYGYGRPAPYYGGGGYYRQGNGCPRGYTVQSGVCKPYRGY
jgi:hypothetical protein